MGVRLTLLHCALFETIVTNLKDGYPIGLEHQHGRRFIGLEHRYGHYGTVTSCENALYNDYYKKKLTETTPRAGNVLETSRTRRRTACDISTNHGGH